jgi:hypothetical protein
MRAPHCGGPFLFHGPHCAAGRKASKAYGCVGDFKKSWASACEDAGFPVGRKAGGYVFHHTRNTAATNLRAGGMEEADALKITGHTTTHVFRHYDAQRLHSRAILGSWSAVRGRSRSVRGRLIVVLAHHPPTGRSRAFGLLPKAREFQGAENHFHDAVDRGLDDDGASERQDRARHLGRRPLG